MQRQDSSLVISNLKKQKAVRKIFINSSTDPSQQNTEALNLQVENREKSIKSNICTIHEIKLAIFYTNNTFVGLDKILSQVIKKVKLIYIEEITCLF